MVNLVRENNRIVHSVYPFVASRMFFPLQYKSHCGLIQQSTSTRVVAVLQLPCLHCYIQVTPFGAVS